MIKSPLQLEAKDLGLLIRKSVLLEIAPNKDNGMSDELLEGEIIDFSVSADSRSRDPKSLPVLIKFLLKSNKIREIGIFDIMKITVL